MPRDKNVALPSKAKLVNGATKKLKIALKKVKGVSNKLMQQHKLKHLKKGEKIKKPRRWHSGVGARRTMRRGLKKYLERPVFPHAHTRRFRNAAMAGLGLQLRTAKAAVRPMEMWVENTLNGFLCDAIEEALRQVPTKKDKEKAAKVLHQGNKHVSAKALHAAFVKFCAAEDQDPMVQLEHAFGEEAVKLLEKDAGVKRVRADDSSRLSSKH